jgi:selenoprotein W-related protein
MTNVEIEYCVPCGHLPRAQDLQQALLEAYGQQLETVSLRTGDSGVFKVRVDDDLIFDKAEDEFDADAIVDTVGTYA